MTDQELVEAHWEYVEELLQKHFTAIPQAQQEQELEIIGFHYCTAMLHGVKHGRELAQQETANGTNN